MHHNNKNEDPNAPLETTIKHGGDVIVNVRNYADPPTNMDVVIVYDTQYAVVKVHAKADSIHFFSENNFLSKHSALISDSLLSGNNRYMVSTIRPISYYQLREDSLVFWSSFADPTGGPYYKKVTYNGIKL